MTSKKMGRTVSPPSLQLEDCLGSYGALGEIRSGSRYRKETIQDIKVQLSRWMANKDFEPIKGKQLDVAIVIKCSPYRFKKQDTDNIAKIICDALKEKKGDNRYLFNDDSQIIRLLVWKIQRTDNQYYDTDSYDISFRIHDCNKPMTLIPSLSYIRMEGQTSRCSSIDCRPLDRHLSKCYFPSESKPIQMHERDYLSYI